MFQQKDITVGGWLLFLILSGIPFVNVIVWLVLLAGKDTNKSLKNLLKLELIIFVIMIVIVIAVYGAAILSAF